MQEVHYITPAYIYDELSQATCFTVIDFKKGYWQEAFDDESSYPTTFSTPFGR